LGEIPEQGGAFEEVRADRRTFVKRVATATAFAAPIVMSYDMASLTTSVAAAAGNSTRTVTLTPTVKKP
jgi:hypothetical protein